MLLAGVVAQAVTVILGIHGGHDGSCCVVKDGRLVAALASERLTRSKKSGGVQDYVLDAVLGQAGVRLEDVDAVAVTDWYREWAHGLVTCYSADERFTNTDGRPLPIGAAIPDSWDRIWDDEVWTMEVEIRGLRFPGYNVGHQKAHCAAAFYTSPFHEAWCMSMDSSGAKPKNNYMLARGKGNRLDWCETPLCMAGVAYGRFCDRLCIGSQLFKAGAMMALAGYGTIPGWCHGNIERWVDGAFCLWHEDYHHSLDQFWCEASRGTTFNHEVSDGKAAQDIAATVQEVFELAVLRAMTYIPVDGCENLCLGGGSFLNCNVNARIRDTGRFANMHLFPACTDDGCSVGGALYTAHAILDEPRASYTNADLAYLGPQRAEGEPDLERVADAIADGKLVAWFQGRSEYGPRALGHRSILADPRRVDMTERINKGIKDREWYRPLAPSVIDTACCDWFSVPGPSPFMLFTADCLRPDEVPAVVHKDGSSRMQTVSEADNPTFYRLIKAFQAKTGVPMVLNTSLNVNGQPILETEEHARQFWQDMPVDMMVLGGEVLER